MPNPEGDCHDRFRPLSGASRFATRPNIVARLVQVAFNLFKALKNRREFYRLGDIVGRRARRYRADARRPSCRATAHPLGTDPTAALGVIVQRRAEDEEAAARIGLLNKPFPQASPLHTGSHRSPADCPVPQGPGIFRCCRWAWSTGTNESSFRAVTAFTAWMKMSSSRQNGIQAGRDAGASCQRQEPRYRAAPAWLADADSCRHTDEDASRPLPRAWLSLAQGFPRSRGGDVFPGICVPAYGRCRPGRARQRTGAWACRRASRRTRTRPTAS